MPLPPHGKWPPAEGSVRRKTNILLGHFPGVTSNITIRFIKLYDKRTTLAICSRSISIYGEGHMGLNKARIRDWIGRLNTMLKLS